MTSYTVRIGHVHIKVRLLQQAIDFYTHYLNFSVNERIGDQMAFLSGGSRHHELALQAVGSDAPGQHPYGVGLYHAAFEVPDRTAFASAYNRLIAGGVHVTAVDHAISWALYFSDLDGNGVEIYVDTRHQPDGAPQWDGRSRHLDAAEVRAAGGL
ncbi:MAG: VOC family protein [Chloroflexota bacterium]